MNKKLIIASALLVTVAFSFSGFIGTAQEAETETSAPVECLAVEPWWGICNSIVNTCKQYLGVCNKVDASG
jgi:hypothetical protein